MARIKKMQVGGKTPTTPKEKRFAALAEPKDTITAADRIAGAKKSSGMARDGKKVKKAQGGTKVALRPGQLKRLGRLSAKNPAKAEKVGGKMIEKATRQSRGKEYLKKNAPKMLPEVPEVRKGMKVKKARSGATLSPSNKSTSSNLAGYKRVIGKSMRMGGSMKKCRGGCY
jgi:hypothetical protein